MTTPIRQSYANHEYGPDHWSITGPPSHFLIGSYKIGNCYYIWYLNPTDRRNYRSILRLWHKTPEKRQKLLNRPYSPQEISGLYRAAGLAHQVYSSLGLDFQMSQAGNNSYQTDEETGGLIIGKPNEPGMLHLHFWGIGNPTASYIPDVPLCGIEIGTLFNMRQGKMPWSSGEECSAAIQAFIETIRQVENETAANIGSLKQKIEELDTVLRSLADDVIVATIRFEKTRETVGELLVDPGSDASISSEPGLSEDHVA